jgi:hypothetical protein
MTSAGSTVAGATRPPAAVMPATTCLRPSQVPATGIGPRVGHDDTEE